MSRIYCTLDPHRCGDGLTLSQGNLIVTTNKVCDFHRMVLGTQAIGVGTVGFECYFYSTSFPSAGLANLTSVGVAVADCALDKVVGEEVSADSAAEPMSWGLISAGGLVTAGPGIYAGGDLVVSTAEIAERACIGVLLRNGPSPYVSWQANGNYLGQVALPTGKFYVPAVSIGSSASPTDVAAFLNFGQRGLDFPAMTLDL